MIDQVALKAAMLGGEMTWQQVREALVQQTELPWHTEEWKRRRNALLKATCKQCGSANPPLVIQHFWHPRSLISIHDSIAALYRIRYEQTHPMSHIKPPTAAGERPVCPECGSYMIRYRKVKASWKCYGQRDKQPCYHDFTTPALEPVLTPAQNEAYLERKRAAHARWNDDFQAQYSDEIGTQMVLVSIEEYTRYTSFEDTATFCKRCAFLWDTKGLTLCSVCRSQFHSRLYTCCAACAGTSNVVEHGISYPLEKSSARG